MHPFGKKIIGHGVFVPIELTVCGNLDLELESREQDKRHNFVHETHISTKSLNWKHRHCSWVYVVPNCLYCLNFILLKPGP